MNIGAHMSAAGGVDKALERGKSIGIDVVQLFTKNQRQWAAPPLKAENVDSFRSQASSFYSIFSHTSYLINLASPQNELYEKSITSMADELKRALELGIKMVVLHPGAHIGSGIPQGTERIARGIISSYELAGVEALEKVRILLETTAGQGSTIGSKFEELRDILDLLQGFDIPVSICLDTCHIFAAGYDISRAEVYEKTITLLSERVGLDQVRVIHLNDSQGELGSRRDRHQHIGRGKIGVEGFRLIVNDRRFRKIPMCLETPKGPDMKEDLENLALLRSLKESR